MWHEAERKHPDDRLWQVGPNIPTGVPTGGFAFGQGSRWVTTHPPTHSFLRCAVRVAFGRRSPKLEPRPVRAKRSKDPPRLLTISRSFSMPTGIPSSFSCKRGWFRSEFGWTCLFDTKSRAAQNSQSCTKSHGRVLMKCRKSTHQTTIYVWCNWLPTPSLSPWLKNSSIPSGCNWPESVVGQKDLPGPGPMIINLDPNHFP